MKENYVNVLRMSRVTKNFIRLICGTDLGIRMEKLGSKEVNKLENLKVFYAQYYVIKNIQTIFFIFFFCITKLH